jgi:hypothetical protein
MGIRSRNHASINATCGALLTERYAVRSYEGWISLVETLASVAVNFVGNTDWRTDSEAQIIVVRIANIEVSQVSRLVVMVPKHKREYARLRFEAVIHVIAVCRLTFSIQTRSVNVVKEECADGAHAK